MQKQSQVVIGPEADTSLPRLTPSPFDDQNVKYPGDIGFKPIMGLIPAFVQRRKLISTEG